MTNESQAQIIKNSQTPACVIAGPGTGKTYTIVGKVVELVKNEGIAANRILITTFTKKAARELNTRIISQFKEEGLNTDLRDLKIGNFHSLARIFLEDYGKYLIKPTVIDSFMEGYILERNLGIFKEIEGFDAYIKGNQVKKIQEIFESVTNNLIDLDKLKNSPIVTETLAYEVYTIHLNLLKENQLMNFQMILKDFYDLLTDDQIGREIRESIDYVIIDEYQDTNFIQQEIAFKLVRDKNIMVFGDDDQALYSFRGADPKNLLDFDKICQEKFDQPANFYQLDINYRSNQAIIDFARDFIRVDELKNSYDKNLTANDSKANANSLVRARAQAFDNLYKIIKYLNKDINLNQIAFLFPTLNSDYPKKLKAYFESQGLAVVSKGESSFYDQDEIRLIVYIYAAIFSSYPENLTYNEYMPFEDKQRFFFRNYIANLFDDENFATAEINDFIKFSSRNKLTLNEIFYRALELSPLRAILSQKLGELVTDRAQKNIARMSGLISDYMDLFDKTSENYELEFIYGYLFYFFKTKAIKDFEEEDDDYANALNFMTIHQAKGLEFDVVFVSGLNDSPRKNDDKILRNFERVSRDHEAKFRDYYRKYYTAFTRAKRLLVLLDNSVDYRLREAAASLPADSAINTLAFKRLDPVEDKEIFAYTTDIEVYKTCPARYKFVRKLGFRNAKTPALKKGSHIHELSQYYGNKKLANKGFDELIDFIKANEAYKNPLIAYMTHDFPIKETETNYKLDRDFYILQGMIDVILADGSVIDIKTGSYSEKTLEKYFNQLLTYKELMAANGDSPEKLLLYFIEKDELIEVRDTGFDISEIDEIARLIINEEIYPKTADINDCKFCPMKFTCQRY